MGPTPSSVYPFHFLFPQFCPEHKDDHGPIVLSEKLSKTSRDFLRRHQDSKLPQGQTTMILLLLMYV